MKIRLYAALFAISALCASAAAGISNAQDISKSDLINGLKDKNASSTRSLSLDTAETPKDTPAFIKDGAARGLKIEERKQLDTYVVKYERPALDISIPFALNSADLSEGARKVLLELAGALTSAELKDSKFALGGHTDASGSAPHNQALSERRALSVKSFLASYNVAPERLIAAGYGEERPKKGLDPSDAGNRRVEVVNLGVQ